MRKFPDNLLVARPAVLGGTPGDAWLNVPLEPFVLEGATNATALILEGIGLETLELKDLQGKRFDGAVDGSIYIQHAHHPFDVTALVFGTLHSGGLPLSIKGRLELEHEGLYDYASTQVVIHTVVIATQSP